MKTCSRCKTEKPLDAFNKNRSNKDGLQYLCRVCQRAACYKWHRKNPVESMFINYRTRARRKGLDFHLTLEDFEKLSRESCTYCGSISVVGYDRIDSNLGYSLDNVAPCCKVCNRAKSDMTHADFIAYIERIYHYQETE